MDVLKTIAKDVHQLAALTDMPAEDLHHAETPEDFSITFRLSDTALSRIKLKHLAPLAGKCGEALTCRFLLDDMVLLEVDSTTTEVQLDEMKRELLPPANVKLDIKLRKTKLLSGLGISDEYRCYMFLFPETLEKLLRGPLDRIEATLWTELETSRLLVIVPEWTGFAAGPCLTVLGGNALEKAKEEYSGEGLSSKYLRDVYQKCREHTRWNEQWLQFLTPFHLSITTEEYDSDRSAALLAPLHARFVDCALLFTAKRSFRDGEQALRVRFESSRGQIDVKLLGSHEKIEDTSQLNSLHEMLRWLYASDEASAYQTADRYSMLQLALTRSLGPFPAVRNAHEFSERIPSVLDEITWNWKVYVEGKVLEYSDVVNDLEEVLSTTIDSYSQQMSAMVDRVATTALGTVALVIGFVVAEIVGESPDMTLMAVGLILYGLYILLFPLTLHTCFRVSQVADLRSDFAERKRDFEKVLFPEIVKKVVDDRIKRSEARFNTWAVITILIYFLMGTAIAVVGAALLP